MKPKSTLRHFLALVGSSLLAVSSAQAVDGTWSSVNAGNWSDSANWAGSPDPVPGGAGSIISIASDITANRTVTINTDSRTVGQLTIGDASNSHYFTLAASGVGAGLIFDNDGDGATLTSTTTLATLTTSRDTISAPITLADNLAVSVAGTMAGTSSTGYLAISGNIGESGGAKSITKSGNGTLVLTGNNSYTGGFILNAGTVQVTAGSNDTVNPYTGFGTGTLTINGGTIGTRSSGSFTTTNDSVWNASFGLFRGQTGVATWNHQGDVTLGANITPTLPNNGFILNISGNIGETGGARSLTVNNGNLTMTLSGSNNTFSGGTTLTAGTLNINSATAVGTGTLTIGGGTINNTSGSAVTLTTNNAQAWNANIAFTGANDLNLGTGAVTMNNNRTVTVTANTLTVGGAIGQSGGNRTLTKAGAGTLVLGGDNTYLGTTTVSVGTLLINGDSSAATGATTVNGNLNPGASPGVLSFSSSLALGANSTTTMEINGTTRGDDYDGVNVGTTLSLGGALVFEFGNLSAFAANTEFDLFSFDTTSTGDFTSVSSTGFYAGTWIKTGDIWSLTDEGQTLNFSEVTGNLVVIPEPRAALLGGLGLLVLLRRRRG
jgi:autotransporter-associated beta strand protein